MDMEQSRSVEEESTAIVSSAACPASEPAIQVERVSMFYDAKAAVDEFSLDGPRGSIFGLIGPNGSGKTTTLKMISTLIKPDAGSIRVCGLDLARQARDVRPLIGYMPDQFGVFRGLSLVEYLQFFGRIFGLYARRLSERIEAVLALTDLERVRGELTTALSTGVRQRLSMAKTLLHDPEILVLDEPASGLDPRARIEIRSLLKELGRMGKTIIISSHILSDLEEICTDVAIIEDGKHIWSGPLKAVKAGDGAQVDAVLRVPEPAAERAVSLLKGLDQVIKVAARGEGRLEARIAAESSNEVLSALIKEGIEIVSFNQESVDLERLFLERTRGIVS